MMTMIIIFRSFLQLLSNLVTVKLTVKPNFDAMFLFPWRYLQFYKVTRTKEHSTKKLSDHRLTSVSSMYTCRVLTLCCVYTMFLSNLGVYKQNPPARRTIQTERAKWKLHVGIFFFKFPNTERHSLARNRILNKPLPCSVTFYPALCVHGKPPRLVSRPQTSFLPALSP